MCIDRAKIISDYVVANEKRLKNLCFRLYKGNYLWEDLFQEFYLEVLDTPKLLFDRYSLKHVCYYKILTIYKNRNRKNSTLRDVEYMGLDHVKATVETDYIADIQEWIDKEINKEHGFADILVFKESQDKSLRQIKKETGVSLFALCRLRQEGQRKLQRLLA